MSNSSLKGFSIFRSRGGYSRPEAAGGRAGIT
jgi:hypothetical protein